MKTESRHTLKYLVADFVSTNVAIFLFNIFRYYELPIAHHSFESLAAFLSFRSVIISQIGFPIMMMGAYYLSGIYNKVYLRSRVSELFTTMSTAIVGTLMLFFAVLINDLTNERDRDYSLFFMLFAMMFVCVYIPRVIITWRTNRKILKREISFNTLIVGFGSHPDLFISQIRNIVPATGVKVCGLIDSENRLSGTIDGLDYPVSPIDEIKDVCSRREIKQIIVIPHSEGWNKTIDIVSKLLILDLPILISAANLPPFLFNTHIISLTAEPYIDITKSRMSASTLNIKRTFDVVMSSVMLLLTAIPIGLTAVAIKLTSPGPVFYRQRRLGLNKKPFDIIKLRTMRVDAEADNRPALSHSGDSRVTPIGRFLRKYRIDELPQFYNVLKGDMSIVGPRPERPEYMEEITGRQPIYALLHRVRPGITSLGMVKYGYASSVEQIMQRMQYEILYLENISMVFDIKIILHTAHTVISGKGV